MRPARAERRQNVLQLGIGCRRFDELLRNLAELLIIEAAAQQLELHLKAAGITDALDRWWRHDGKPTIRSSVELALQVLGDRQDVGPFRLAALVKRLEHDIADACAGEVSGIIEHRRARYRDNR